MMMKKRMAHRITGKLLGGQFQKKWNFICSVELNIRHSSFQNSSFLFTFCYFRVYFLISLQLVHYVKSILVMNTVFLLGSNADSERIRRGHKCLGSRLVGDGKEMVATLKLHNEMLLQNQSYLCWKSDDFLLFRVFFSTFKLWSNLLLPLYNWSRSLTKFWMYFFFVWIASFILRTSFVFILKCLGWYCISKHS